MHPCQCLADVEGLQHVSLVRGMYHLSAAFITCQRHVSIVSNMCHLSATCVTCQQHVSLVRHTPGQPGIYLASHHIDAERYGLFITCQRHVGSTSQEKLIGLARLSSPSIGVTRECCITAAFACTQTAML